MWFGGLGVLLSGVGWLDGLMDRRFSHQASIRMFWNLAGLSLEVARSTHLPAPFILEDLDNVVGRLWDLGSRASVSWTVRVGEPPI